MEFRRVEWSYGEKYDSALFCCIYTIDAALKANTPDIAQTCLNMVIDQSFAVLKANDKGNS